MQPAVMQVTGKGGLPNGDVFYLHARLLERGTKLNDALGGGVNDRVTDLRERCVQQR